MLLVLYCLQIAGALSSPFVTTWNVTEANETIRLPFLNSQSNLTIDWGDSATDFAENSSQPIIFNHTYETPGLYNVSLFGAFRWNRDVLANRTKLVDIVSWGDGLIVDSSSGFLFSYCPNLRVSAPPNTQPVTRPGATFSWMFAYTSFNSSLNWDLINVTDISGMFTNTPLNQPITFRNTQLVVSMDSLFRSTLDFNQPFSFNAISVTNFVSVFEFAFAFNSPVTLTNTQNIVSTSKMFANARAFNQPVVLQTDSVVDMSSMFANAESFNQPLNFTTTNVVTMKNMFLNAYSFNQPINFSMQNLATLDSMFENAVSLNQPVVMATHGPDALTMTKMFYNAHSFASTVNFSTTNKVSNMANMFWNASQFTQNLVAWDTSVVVNCNQFCDYCGLPAFPGCTPCASQPVLTNTNVSVCSTRAPTTTPAQTSAPTPTNGSLAPTMATVADSSSLLTVPTLFISLYLVLLNV